MQDLENINQIVLDPFGNIYEIYANLIVMIILNFNHFWVIQAELYLKGTLLCKSKFHVSYHFLDIYEHLCIW